MPDETQHEPTLVEYIISHIQDDLRIQPNNARLIGRTGLKALKISRADQGEFLLGMITTMGTIGQAQNAFLHETTKAFNNFFYLDEDQEREVRAFLESLAGTEGATLEQFLIEELGLESKDHFAVHPLMSPHFQFAAMAATACFGKGDENFSLLPKGRRIPDAELDRLIAQFYRDRGLEVVVEGSASSIFGILVRKQDGSLVSPNYSNFGFQIVVSVDEAPDYLGRHFGR